MGDEKPPALPANLPQDLRDFVECKTASVTIKDGAQAWVTLPDEIKGFVPKDSKPELKIEPGSTPGSATIKVTLGPISLSLPATVKDGRLSIHTNELPMFAPASIAKDLTSFVDSLNAWFKANGKGLAPPAFGAGQTSLSKVPLAPMPATQPPSEYIKPTIDLVPDLPPTPLEPMTFPDYDAMTANELNAALQPILEELQIWMDSKTGGMTHVGAILASKSAAEDAATLDGEIQDWIIANPAYGTNTGNFIEVREAQELTENRAKLHLIQAALAATKASVVTPQTPAAPKPVIGAGGPGGPKAPAGLEGLAWRYVILVAVVAALGLGAFVVLSGGKGGPVATLAPSSQATKAVPGETTAVIPTPQPTVAVSVAPAVIFAPYEITGDQQVDHCEHIYTVVFTIKDANGQSDIYAGKTALFHLLDNEADRTGTVGDGGKLEATVDEHFQKSGSSCFSHLQPHVTSVDGQPVF